MRALLIQADDLLRMRFAGDGQPARSLWRFLFLTIVFGVLYGAVMGAYWASRDPWLQVLYSASKVPLLLTVTFVLALPSFFVLNTLLGTRDDFPEVLRALLATQAALTVVLASLAPFTALWYLSVENYELAILFNAGMFGVASLAAQWLLRRHYAPLIARRRAHRALLRIWLVLFAFVGIQMAWVLRPFIGTPGGRAQFFREGAWSNAYVALMDVVVRLLS